MEEWRSLKDYPDYQFSSKGRVKNIRTGKILSQEVSKIGYPTVRIFNKDHVRKHINTHLLIAKAFLGEPNQCVNHIDGNKLNNNVENLEWCTYAYNNKHAYDHKLRKPYQQRISDEERIKVGIMLGDGVKVKDIAKIYNVTEGCIYQLIKRRQVTYENIG